MRSALVYFAISSIALMAAYGTECFFPSNTWLAVCLLGVILLYPLWFALTRLLVRRLNTVDLFSPLFIYPVAYIAWFALGSIDFISVPSSVSFGAFEPITAHVFWLAAIGLVGYLLGAIAVLRRGTNCFPGQFAGFHCQWDPAKMRRMAVVASVVTLLSFAYTIAVIGVPLLNLKSLGEERIDFTKIPFFHVLGSPSIYGAYTILFFVSAWLWVDVASNANRSTRQLLWCARGMLLIALVIVSSQGSRAAFVGPILTLLILYHYTRHRLSIRKVALLMLVTFMFFSAFGYFRDLTSDQDPEENWMAVAGIPPAVQPLVYVGFYIRYSVATLRDVAEIIPAQIPFQYGAITSLPLQVLLPGHRGMSDMYFKNLLGNEFVGQGQPATTLGPFYADFGAPGVFLGMLTWGIILSKLYLWMLKRRMAGSAIVFAWAMQAGLFGLMGGMFGYFETLVCPIAWVALDRYLRRAPTTINAYAHE